MSPKQSDPTVANSELEHTEGGVTTRDPMDAGVPMTPGQPTEPVGPEDAMGPGPTRGNYADRLQAGPSMRTELIPEAEREPDGPVYRLVRVDAPPVADEPGKGGVSTAAAREAFGDAGAPTPTPEGEPPRS